MAQAATKLPKVTGDEGQSSSRGLSNSFAKMIAENSTDAIAVADADGMIEWVNAAWSEMTEYTLEECIGKSSAGLTIGPDTDRTALRELARAGIERRAMRCELIHYRKSGDRYWAETVITPIFDEQERLTHHLVVGRDVTDRKLLEAEREQARKHEAERQSERRVLAKTTEWLYAARSLEDLYNVVEQCAPKLMPSLSGALYIYSNSRDVLDLAVAWGESPSPDFMEPDECWALRRGRAYHYGVEEIEFPCGHYHEEVTSSFCLPLLAHGETIGMLWCHTDEEQADENDTRDRYWDVALMLAEQVSLTIANVRLRQELQDRSIKDPLTGLWNRRYFLDTLRREKVRADSNAMGFALISIDIDHFKRFNDHHGHDAGDVVLRRVSSELVTTAGSAGFVCRVGGEELAVICPDLDEQAAMDLAHKLHAAVKRTEIVYQGEILPCVTFSAGVANYPSDHGSIDELMRNADNALYQAKRAGRDRVVLFEAESDDRWVLARDRAD
ncbi:MAG: diguanylate cyclase [Pseudomonadota bacterium]